ncbi:MAG: fibronectin type III domain-containing protein, partial [Patescibacteria group bacterium]|nr:fibronectin type III domain-containing protein [Patescibacteria group bacterium]
SNVRFEQQKNMATSTLKVTWDSNVPLTGVVKYREANGGNTREVSSSKLVTKHSMMVTGLKDNTDYVMTVDGRDAYGNLAVSDANKVRTDFDTRPPEILNVTTETEIQGFGLEAKGQIIVSWETDEPATSQVEYGIGSSGNYTNRTQEDTSLTTSHVVIISDLKTSSPYHFRIISKDKSANEGKSDEHATLTPQASRGVLDVIINSLQSAIGWLFSG